ncbi:hypothetical protein M9H77_07802 [Catharanthus roseus]|uniref:Uncharacterized protein n=1 Tax=Catharanthus roseus TaxID=4058 RepID=A0ACC0BVX8_CATRO|nr:hypothetical protein M9H77_07802 [Catharanthus roseus]
MNGSLKVLKSHLCDLVKTTFGNGVFELNLKSLVEKHLVYFVTFIDFLFKDDTLNDFLALKFFVYTSFSYHRPFKELCYLWNSYGIETLVDKLDTLFAYFLLSFECLVNIHSIVPFNAYISNVARFLWLFEGTDSRTNIFKGEADAKARRIEEEHRGKIAIFKKMIQDLAWQVI